MRMSVSPWKQFNAQRRINDRGAQAVATGQGQ
jgi:hypothetical protein